MALGGGEEDLGGNNGSRDELIASSFIVPLSLSILSALDLSFSCVGVSLSSDSE